MVKTKMFLTFAVLHLTMLTRHLETQLEESRTQMEEMRQRLEVASDELERAARDKTAMMQLIARKVCPVRYFPDCVLDTSY